MISPNGTGSSLRRNESGVSTIEFALIAFLFFGIIGFIFDLGLGWFRYSNLVSTVGTAARTVSQSVFRSRGETCAVVEARAATIASNLYSQQYDVGRPTFNATVIQPAGGPNLIQITGNLPMECIFCSMIRNITLRAQAEAMIEHRGFSCTP